MTYIADGTERPYQPISCTTHDELLALATLGRTCTLTFAAPSGAIESRKGRIIDVYSRSGAEYLRLDDGTVMRLDDLRTVDGKEVGPAED